MQTSAQGVASIEHEEGVVLRAYRCPAGVWTIGAGLTAASGVVKPHAGMMISKSVATNLLQMALRGNYEPAVTRAMPKAKQHEFDAGVGFHFNTGAIGRASWVKGWRENARQAEIKRRLFAWNKGGGKVLPGLVKRREREAVMLFERRYPVQARQATPPPLSSGAIWAIPATNADKAAAQDGFRELRYLTGPHSGVIPVEVVKEFQRKHGLTVDGIIGRATLSTLQRMLNARANAVPAVGAPAVAANSSFSGADEIMTGLPYAGEIAFGLGLVFTAYIAFTYRDAIAAAAHDRFPRLAGWLRSF